MTTPQSEPAPAPAAVPATPPAAAPAAEPAAAPVATVPGKAEPAPAPGAVVPPAAEPKPGDPPPEGDPSPKPGEPGKEGDPKPPTGAPEKYEEFKVPDGMKPDESLTTEFTGLARKHNLSQEAAQELVDFYGGKLVEKMTKDSADAWAATTATWAKQIQDDPALGGDKFNENAELAKQTIRVFGNDQLVEFLNATGLGNHPELFKFCLRIGQGMKEDKVVIPSESGVAKIPAWEALYPTMKQP